MGKLARSAQHVERLLATCLTLRAALMYLVTYEISSEWRALKTAWWFGLKLTLRGMSRYHYGDPV